jgi:hypothetical protein
MTSSSLQPRAQRVLPTPFPTPTTAPRASPTILSNNDTTREETQARMSQLTARSRASLLTLTLVAMAFIITSSSSASTLAATAASWAFETQQQHAPPLLKRQDAHPPRRHHHHHYINHRMRVYAISLVDELALPAVSTRTT